MEFLDEFIKWTKIELTSLFPFITLFLILIHFIFPNRFQTRRFLEILRWTVIIYAGFLLMGLIIDLLFLENIEKSLIRASSPYGLIYITLIFCSTVLPFSLLYKPISKNYFAVLLVTILLNLSLYFEMYVIIITSLHSEGFDTSWKHEITWLLVIVSQALITTIIGLILLQYSKTKTN